MIALLAVLPLSVSLAQPLTADEAARLALSRNPAFKALMEEVGVAEADLTEAGLPANPRFHGALRYAGTQGGARGHELGVKIDLLSLFALPLKKRVTSSRLEQARFRLSHEVLGLETEVKAAFYDYVAAARRLELRRDAVAALDAAATLSRRGREAGNVSRLDQAVTEAVHQEGLVELARDEAAVAVARERLARLAGLQNEPDWSVPSGWPELPAADADPVAVEKLAVSRRWDLAAARTEPKVLEDARRLENRAIFGPLELGVDSEREYGGQTGYGPEFEVGVPLFDRRQGGRARVRALTRQSLASADALEAHIRFEVRAAAANVAAARKAVEARRAALPLRRDITSETLKNYNYMLLGADTLLAAKREELQAAAALSDAFKDYWTARAELDRASGGDANHPGGS